MRFIDSPLGGLVIGVIGVIAALSGCRSGRYTPEGFCGAEAEAFCRFQYECCTASERVDAFSSVVLVHHTEEECVEAYTKAICSSDATIVDSVEGGRATWSEAKAEACYRPLFDALEACDAATVLTFTATGAACEGYLVGTRGDGESCYEDYECESARSLCAPNISGDPDSPLVTSKGTCQPAPLEGEACFKGKCGEGLFCDFAAAKCAARRPDDEPCNDPEQCASERCSTTTGRCTSDHGPDFLFDLCDGPDD